MHQGYYAPPPQPPSRDVITVVDVLLPIMLSIMCGIGGFVWGLIRMAQGHHKPGLVAMGINLAVWLFGLGLWAVVIAASMLMH